MTRSIRFYGWRWGSVISAVLVSLFVFASVVTAQDDLGWITDLLPDGNNINIDKQLEQGAIIIATDEQRLLEEFTAQNAWDNTNERDGNRRVNNARYEMRMRLSNTIFTGLGTQNYTNTVITVDTERLSTEPNDGFGLVCRAEDEENGVHFFISSDGFWRIFAFEDGSTRPFVSWTQSDLINMGENATNRITAVCVDDYFALYINGVLAGEATDDTFSEGAVGMSVIVFEEASEVSIAFDNLRVWSATAGSGDTTALNGGNDTSTSSTETAFDEQRAATVLRLQDADESLALNGLILAATLDDDSETDWQFLERDGSVEFGNGSLEIESDEGAEYPSMLLTSTDSPNVVVQAEVSFDDGDDNNAYGLACRSGLNEVGRGYHFNISADGFYTVWVTDGDFFRFLVDWERASVIEVNGTNEMTIVCVDDYFALFVNDVLLTDFYDNTYLTGSVGFTAFTFEDDTAIRFDDLFVWEAVAQD
ncbi:MAG: hypothetical protein AAFN11_08185 [Chloroflexota bacterium]